MGGSSSKNVANITTEAVSSQTMDIINDSKTTGGQNQIISITNVDGDVVIKDNVMNQNAVINTDSLLKNLSTQKAQQDLSQKLAQSAKAITSGINLFQFSKSENILNAFMMASVDLTTNIKETCGNNLQQNQTIKVDRVNGNVTVADNQMKNINKIFSKCVNSNMTNQSSIQDLQQQVDQSAVAESKGFSIWALVAIAVIALLAMVMPIILPIGGALAMLSKFLFPLLMLVGIILIALYFTKKKKTMISYGFSNLIQPEPGKLRCRARVVSTSTDYATAADAEKACMGMDNCNAYDWKGFDIDSQGNAKRLDKPVTTFYTNASRDDCPVITKQQDKSRIVRMPKVVVSEKDPRSETSTFLAGDVYINPQNTKWYRLGDTEWKENDPLVDNFKGTIKFISENTNTPSDDDGKEGDVIVKFAGDFVPYFNVFLRGKQTWDKTETTLPGYAPDVPTDLNGGSAFNSTGFKYDDRYPLFLWIGIGLSSVGLFGTIGNFMKKSNKVVPQK